MPRPRHPIREHFTKVEDSKRRNGGISCNYCGKEQAAGNPKRCQKHLDECAQYAQVLQAIESGQQPPVSFHSPYNSSAANAHGSNSAPQYGAVDGTATYPNNPTPTRGEPTQSPLPIPGRLDEDEIMRLLNIDRALYLEMECELDAQMVSLNIAGAGLHTEGGRTLLRQGFYQINQKWPEQMNAIAERDKTNAMTALAYIANRKRRNGQPPSAATPKTNHCPQRTVSNTVQQLARASDSAPAPSVTVMQQPSQPFGLTTIIAERIEDGGAFVICRPGDLIEEPKEPNDITVNDVKFMPFISLLQHDDDVMFNAADDDKIVHTFTGGRQKTVSNEVVWRVALEEMHRNGANPFVFKIYKRCPQNTT